MLREPMRKRMISDKFWRDEKVGQLTHFERLLFIGLWMMADDIGVLEFDVHEIKWSLFPSDEEATKEACLRGLEHLIRLGMVTTYLAPLKESESKKRRTHGPKRWLYVHNFLAYQSVSHPTPSRLPLPPEGVKIGFQEAPEDSRGLQERSGKLRRTPSQVSLVKVSLEDQIQSQSQERGSFDAPAAAGKSAENGRFEGFWPPTELQQEAVALSPKPGESAAQTKENTPFVENSQETTPEPALLQQGADELQQGGKTVALNQEQAPLARETLIAFTEHVLRKTGQARSPALLALIADAMVKLRAQRHCTWQEAHNVVYTRVALAAHDEPPQDWIDWFRVHGDPPTQELNPINSTGEQP